MKRLAALGAALAIVACNTTRDEQRPPQTDTLAQVSPDTMIAPPRAAARLEKTGPPAGADTAFWRDSTIKSTLAFDSLVFSKGKVITTVSVTTDSQWVAVRRKPIGLPFGMWQTFSDTVCKTGYTSGIVPVTYPASFGATLDSIKACGARVVIAIPQARLRDVNGLSVAAATAEFAKWPWQRICDRVKDSTVIGLLYGDDLTHKQWGPQYAVAQRLAMWDQIGGYLQDRCKPMATMLRFRPSQVKGYSLPHVTTLWLQYTGPKRHGRVQDFMASEIALAKQMKMGLVIGLNILNGGCGPASTGDCFPGIPGTSETGGEGLFQMSAAEVKAYGGPMVDEPYNCTFLSWSYGFGSDFFSFAANRAALDSLQARARKKTPASCVIPR